MQGFNPRDIYNIDEAGLFYECLPSCTYIVPSEKDVHGIKKSKKRVTIVLCTNADGSDKFKLTLISSAENPRCLKGMNKDNLPVYYRSNKSAWMNSDLFIEILQLFDKHVKRRVALIMDNASPHLIAIREAELQKTKILLQNFNLWIAV